MKHITGRLFIILSLIICNSNAQTSMPELFAPNVISTGGRETGITFSKDGKHCLFTKWAIDFSKAEILESRLIKGKWSKPKTVSFSGKFKDQHPQFSPDGKTVYFISQRPLYNGGSKKDYDIWKVNKTESGDWSHPLNLGENVNSIFAEYSPSITSEGKLYFSSEGGKIYTSEYKENEFKERQFVKNAQINSEFQQWHVYVSHDEKVLIFTSLNKTGGKGQEDLYMATGKNGTWGNVKPFIFNDFDHDYLATISPDGNYLFFTSVRYPQGKKEFAKGNMPQNGQPDIYKIKMKDVFKE